MLNGHQPHRPCTPVHLQLRSHHVFGCSGLIGTNRVPRKHRSRKHQLPLPLPAPPRIHSPLQGNFRLFRLVLGGPVGGQDRDRRCRGGGRFHHRHRWVRSVRCRVGLGIRLRRGNAFGGKGYPRGPAFGDGESFPGDDRSRPGPLEGLDRHVPLTHQDAVQRGDSRPRRQTIEVDAIGTGHIRLVPEFDPTVGDPLAGEGTEELCGELVGDGEGVKEGARDRLALEGDRTRLAAVDGEAKSRLGSGPGADFPEDDVVHALPFGVLRYLRRAGCGVSLGSGLDRVVADQSQGHLDGVGDDERQRLGTAIILGRLWDDHHDPGVDDARGLRRGLLRRDRDDSGKRTEKRESESRHPPTGTAKRARHE